MFHDFSQQWKKVDRCLGLNFQHLKMVVEKLAKFHALTAVLYEENEELFDQHQQPNITEDFRIFYSLFEKSFSAVIEKFHSGNVDDDKLYRKLQNFQQILIQRVSDCELQNGEFGVLCHGDLWMHNLLFQYDDNDDSKLLDVELVRFSLFFIF